MILHRSDPRFPPRPILPGCPASVQHLLRVPHVGALLRGLTRGLRQQFSDHPFHKRAGDHRCREKSKAAPGIFIINLGYSRSSSCRHAQKQSNLFELQRQQKIFSTAGALRIAVAINTAVFRPAASDERFSLNPWVNRSYFQCNLIPHAEMQFNGHAGGISSSWTTHVCSQKVVI